MSRRLSIAEVWADGRLVSPRQDAIVGPLPRDRLAGLGDEDGEDRPRRSPPPISPSPPRPGATAMQAALLRPFHWHDDFITMDLPVDDGAVQRDATRNITKFAIVDRFSGEARCRRCSGSAPARARPIRRSACSLGHDKHNIWVRRLVRRGDGHGRQPLAATAGRLGAGRGRQVRRRGPLRGRRADDRPAGRGARCRDAGALSPRARRSTGCMSRPSRRAGGPAFPSAFPSRRSPARPGAGCWWRPRRWRPRASSTWRPARRTRSSGRGKGPPARRHKSRHGPLPQSGSSPR